MKDLLMHNFRAWIHRQKSARVHKNGCISSTHHSVNITWCRLWQNWSHWYHLTLSYFSFFFCFLFLFFETLVGNIQFTVFLFNCCKHWHLGTVFNTMTQSNKLRVWLHQFALIVNYSMTVASIVFSVLLKKAISSFFFHVIVIIWNFKK